MCGSDTFAIEVSMISMNVASVTVIAIAHRLCRGCHGPAAEGVCAHRSLTVDAASGEPNDWAVCSLTSVSG
jgi:hypothetical protein